MCAATFRLDGTETSSKDSFSDQGDRHSQVERINRGPFSGSFLASGIQDLFHQWSVGSIIEKENISGDLDQIRVKYAFVPLVKDCTHFLRCESQSSFHHVIRLYDGQPNPREVDSSHSYFADELHVTIFNSVVYHLDVMPSSFVTHPVAARLIVGFGSNGLENVLDVWPGFFISTWHQAGTVSSSFFSSRDSRSHEPDPFFPKVLGSTIGVRVV